MNQKQLFAAKDRVFADEEAIEEDHNEVRAALKEVLEYIRAGRNLSMGFENSHYEVRLTQDYVKKLYQKFFGESAEVNQP